MTIPTWFVVAVGLLFNIAAALLTHLKVDHLSIEAGVIEQKRQENRLLIDQVWQQIETLERKKEWLVLYDVQAEKGPLDAHLIVVLEPWIKMDPRGSLSDMLAQLDGKQTVLRNSIDGRYFDNIQYGESYQRLMRDMSMYRNLALFLQIIGLALILARDLRRNE
ncbi:hypothetical protein [Thaumasiovibrio subtropicus]|uniref:hypothetical protein n=1 Tax=Thaumasiovibrio subtropicus TaxID=1891207 RepID=UPI000B34EBFF|nr:hypothetical protein [Thaumasiovibrio subtropicus]